MEPISTIIVTALAAGAAAGLTDTAAQAVKDAYAGLKRLIKGRYARAAAGVDVLETDPSSKDLQAFADKQLAASGAANDPDVQKLAQALLDAVEKHFPEAARSIGVDLKDIQAGSMRLADINVQAAGAATGVSASGINVAGDFVIEGVHVSSGIGPAAAPEKPRIKVLFLAANPTDTARLRLGEEVRAIDQALQLARYRDMFDLQQAHAVRAVDLQGLLMRHEPQIVHFSGHGASSGEILFQDDAGRAYPVLPQTLANAFSLLVDHIRCVVLNACFSQSQAKAIAQHVDCVVGMSEEIGDKDARAFAAAFYGGLAYGKSVKVAFELGRNQIDLAGLRDVDVPQLLCPNCDPGAVVFLKI